MTRRMLINAQRPEELRIAIVRDTVLENFQVDVAESGLSRGNIYRGTIANIQPSLNAAFIDYGAERHGFLAIQDVVAEAYYHNPRGQARIEEVLERGKPIVVQVARDAIGQKGASLTTSLSLAGRYLVLTPFDDTRGVSRKVEEEETRRKLKALVANLELPEGCGVIVRTNALDQNKTAISRDLAALLRLWKRVQTAAVAGKGSRLLYSDQDLIVQALRDHLDSSIEQVMVDDEAAYLKAEAYIQAFLPRAKIELVRYEDRLPLFSRFDLEPQIDRIYERRVTLPSGGSIVIDATEALTAIDVNSGRSTRAATQEETALHTNLEAAAEVARQLRMRDLGGLVVVDFIDMRASRNQRRVEKTVRDAMKADKARSTVGRISPNGLLEINRQRIQQALQLRTHRSCPTCDGTGRLASPEMVTLNLLRRVEARAATGMVQSVRIALHPELADAMQNSRRKELAALENEFDIHIEIIAGAGLHRPDERIEWTKRERAVPVPARPKAAPVTLKPWDLTLAATGQEIPVPAQPDEPELDGPEDDAAASTDGGRAARTSRRGSRGGRGRGNTRDRAAAAGSTGAGGAGATASAEKPATAGRAAAGSSAGGGASAAGRKGNGGATGAPGSRGAAKTGRSGDAAAGKSARSGGGGEAHVAEAVADSPAAPGAVTAVNGAGAGEGDEPGEARRRKRRRGGRKRKRGAGHNGEPATATEALEGQSHREAAGGRRYDDHAPDETGHRGQGAHHEDPAAGDTSRQDRGRRHDGHLGDDAGHSAGGGESSLGYANQIGDRQGRGHAATGPERHGRDHGDPAAGRGDSDRSAPSARGGEEEGGRFQDSPADRGRSPAEPPAPAPAPVGSGHGGEHDS